MEPHEVVNAIFGFIVLGIIAVPCGIFGFWMLFMLGAK